VSAKNAKILQIFIIRAKITIFNGGIFKLNEKPQQILGVQSEKCSMMGWFWWLFSIKE
jgi:hypothetical protein